MIAAAKHRNEPGLQDFPHGLVDVVMGRFGIDLRNAYVSAIDAIVMQIDFVFEPVREIFINP